MNMEICAFVPDISDSIIPGWLKRMASIGMHGEIHPSFSFFKPMNYVPFKLKLAYSEHGLLSSQPYLTGFGFSLQTFNLLRQIKAFTPRHTMFDKLLGKGDPRPYFVNEEIDAKLKDFRYCLTFKWRGNDIFELRMATVSAAIIAELTNGLCSFPADNIWYDNRALVEDFAKDADSYENSVSYQDIKLYPFAGWEKIKAER